MSHDDFCKCYFDEFENIYKAWRDIYDGRIRESWEQTRTLAAICIQPHVKKKITPRQLLQFPWDKDKNVIKSSKETHMSIEERYRRAEYIARRLGAETIV